MNYTPYKEGYDAFLYGKPRRFNPFITGNSNWLRWNRGWDKGQKDYEDGKLEKQTPPSLFAYKVKESKVIVAP